MLSSRYIGNTIPQELVDLYADLEMDIIKSYSKRLDKLDYTSEWLKTKSKELSDFRQELNSMVSNTSKKADKILRKTYQEAATKGLSSDEEYYKKLNKLGVLKDYKSLKDSTAVWGLINEAYKAQKMQFNIMNANIVLDSYNKLNLAFARVASGAYTQETAVKMSVNEFADEGVRFFTSKNGRSFEVSSYVRMATQTSVSNAIRESTFARMAELGVNYIQISAHAGARPLCAPYQGNIYVWSGKDPLGKYPSLSDTSYGQPAGIFGINCRHTFGACVPEYPRDIKEIGAIENNKVYKSEQAQRYNERQIRSWKRKADGFAEIKGLEAQATKAREKVQEWQARQRALIEESGLPRQYNRERV